MPLSSPRSITTGKWLSSLRIRAPRKSADIHGVVRLSADPDGERGEFAIVVEDSLTNQGLGWMLMQRILDYAASQGMDEVYGFVLTENQAMLDLCRNLGFRVRSISDSPGIVQVTYGGLRSSKRNPGTHSG